MKNITTAAAMLALIIGMIGAVHAAANTKPPVIAGTYTPPADQDWGCGYGKQITIRMDKSRICPIGPYKPKQ